MATPEERMDGSGGAEWYLTEIVKRGHTMIADDYHATATRGSDKTQLIFISRWRWLLGWRTRRKALVRAFARYDKRQRTLAKKDQFIR